jgi:hypothetical protein
MLSIARLWYGSRTSCPFYGCCVNLYWSRRFHKVVLGHGYSPECIKMMYLFLLVLSFAVLAVWPKPKFSCQLWSSQNVQREQAWVQPQSSRGCGAELDSRLKLYLLRQMVQISTCLSYFNSLYYRRKPLKILSYRCVLVVQSPVVLLPAGFPNVVVNGFMNSNIGVYVKDIAKPSCC